ncbi:MAG: hypothetical protein LBS36_10720 [Oscillospiraceae bacterium]|jgi:hypothetical protein|nr:hypothetical protein [Oscillospiraceae bacterium]
MSEPIRKKPEQAPESYSPKVKPEILSMAEKLQNNAETGVVRPFVKGDTPMNPTEYDFKFSPFRGLDFTNCFTSIFMFLEGFVDESNILKEQQERLFFLFDTVSGRSATVRGWKDTPTAIYDELYDTDDMIDFITGYAGYAYVKHSEKFAAPIRASLDSGVPVLARMKNDKQGSFRVIVSYDGKTLRMPEPKGAQNPPKKPPALGDIDSIYVLSGKIKRRFTLLDGLHRIKRVMDTNRDKGVIDDYIHAFEGYWEKYTDLKLKDLKQLYEYAYKGTTWNCHNFAAPFRTHEYLEDKPEKYQHWIWDEFKDPRFGTIPTREGQTDGAPLQLPPKKLIDWACDVSHTHQWQLHALYETRDWSKKYYHQLEWGFCENAGMLLRAIKEDDEFIYAAVYSMIRVLEEVAS